jgi:hypothetical protein
MPSISSKLVLTTAASASGIALADIDAIRGAFKVYPTYSALTNVPVSLISDKQIVWVESDTLLYQADVTYADYVTTFVDTVTWTQFTGFVSSSVDSVIAGNGLSGGGTQGSVTVNLDTGSAHFTTGVEKVVVVTTLDGGSI